MTMKNSIAYVASVLGGVLVGMAGMVILSQDGTDTDGTTTMHLGIHLKVGDDTASFREGDTCGIAMETWEHVIITDASDAVVGTKWPANGEIRQGDNGNWYCSYYGDVEVEESTFYTFTVNDQYSRVISRETLEATDWSVTLQWPASSSES